jgi:hypothetical protein
MSRVCAASKTRLANAAWRAPIPRLTQATRENSPVSSSAPPTLPAGGPRLKVPEVPVVLELADVVDDEELCGLDRLGVEVEVEVERQREPALAEPAGRERRGRVLGDRAGGDDDFGALDGLARIRAGSHVALERVDALRQGIVSADMGARVQLAEHQRVKTSLLRSRGLRPRP